MFKHLTRTLKLGLTTLTILTAGAGAAFAQPAGFDTAIDPIAACSNGVYRGGPSYCTHQVVNCITNPFGTSTRQYGTGGCATTLGTKAHTVAKVRYCGEASHRAEPACASTVAGVNAAMWAKQHPDARTRLDDYVLANRGGKFVKGTAAGLDLTNYTRRLEYLRGSLYLDTATFNGMPLGGDATDGVSFLNNGLYTYYAGILSGTDLGAPLTQNSGTASWVGQFQTQGWGGYHTISTDFVLEITFGSVASVAGSVGSVKAFIEDPTTYYSDVYFNMDGTFDNTGLIKGKVQNRIFLNNDRKNVDIIRNTAHAYEAVLSGLIGQDGAVGIFANRWYGGGFVARPANLVPDLAPNFIADTCTGPNGDPFHKFCNIGNVGEVAMDEKRKLRVAECIHGGSASNDELCENAVKRNPCILNPFDTDCVNDDNFATHHVAARANRITFCADPTNSASTLCTGDAVANICGYDPFHAVCFTGTTRYNSARTNKINFCGVRANNNDPSCKGTRARVTSANLLQSFTEELPSVPSTRNRRYQFLKGTASGVNKGDTVIPYSVYDGSLNLSTATFNGRALGGDAADGMAFFRGGATGHSWYSYAGIFSGTDLGAPITDTSGTASWVGRFQAIGNGNTADFVLEIDFNGTGDKAGYIKAFVQYSGTYHFYLVGSYDAHGVITGMVDSGSFANNDRDSSTRTPNGTLTGLIGKDGAVGAFYDNNGYSGGFVARPPTTKGENNETTFLRNTCTTDPFHQFCHVDYKTERGTRIEECIDATGSANNNTRCANAITRNPCILNPFADICTEADGGFATYYAEARANRAIFCNGANNATNRLCTTGDLSEKICTYDPFTAICLTGTTHKAARETRFDLCNTEGASNLHCKDMAATRICDYDPFNKICFGQGNIYETAREAKITTCQDKSNDSSCYGARQNPNAVAWADSFATTLPTSPNTSLSNQFLNGGATELSNIGVTEVLPGFLNLATATFGNNPLGGDESDGVAFFRGSHSNRSHYYAGILSGTNLGEPITAETARANWNGSLLYVGPGSSLPNAIDFTLRVNFNPAGDTAGRIRSDVIVPNIGTWMLDGTFDTKGIITGKLVAGISNIGIMTGLIGQRGAVGAFYGTGNSNFSGGFVACPYDSVNNRCER